MTVHKDYIQQKASSTTATLEVASWSSQTQSVEVAGSDGKIVIVSPSPTSFADYCSAKIYCSGQSGNNLTFTCDTVPTTAITVNVVIL